MPLFLLLTIFASFHYVEAESWHKGYRYLMYSDPMYVKFDDGLELKLVVTASATHRKDTLAFSVNDQVVDEDYLSPRKNRATLTHERDGLKIRLVCTPHLAGDSTFNHLCSVAIDGEVIGRLNLDKRLYPKGST